MKDLLAQFQPIFEKKKFIAFEGIDHLQNSKLGEGIEEVLTSLRSYNRVTQATVISSKLAEVIKTHTGLTFNFIIEDMINMYVYPPDINKNNVMLNQAERWIYENIDGERLLKSQSFINGVVDLKNGKVTGDFTKLNLTMGIGEPFLYKYSEFTIQESTAIILHEIGHAFVYLEMLTRLMKSNYIMLESSKRLMKAETKEQRLKILNEVESGLDIKIKDKNDLAETKKKADVYQTVILQEDIVYSESNYGFNIYDTRAFEQLADNFAARHGYQRALATGLDRMYSMFGDRAYMHPAWNLVLNIVQFLSYVCVAAEIVIMIASGTLAAITGIIYGFTWIMLLIGIGNPLKYDYDPLEYRVIKLRQQVNDALKDRTLPIHQQKKLIDDAKVIDDVLSKMYLDNVTFYDWLWKTLNPFQWKNVKEVNLQYKLEEMLNNSMYSAAAGLNVAVKGIESYQDDKKKRLDETLSLEDFNKRTESYIERNMIKDPVHVLVKGLSDGINTKLYHVSDNDALEGLWFPKFTSQIAEKDTKIAEVKMFNKEEAFIARISLSDRIESCIQTSSTKAAKLSKNNKPYEDTYVYVPVLTSGMKIITPQINQDERYVWDAWFSHEYGILDPVYMKLVYKIRVFNFSKMPKIEVFAWNDPMQKGYVTSFYNVEPENIKIEILEKYL